jgi:hypothetical protein
MVLKASKPSYTLLSSPNPELLNALIIEEIFISLNQLETRVNIEMLVDKKSISNIYLTILFHCYKLTNKNCGLVNEIQYGWNIH